VARRVVVKAPASIANLGPGFDILAIAIEGLYDIVEVHVAPGSSRVFIESYGFDVPSGEGNVAYHVPKRFVEKLSVDDYDLHLVVRKGIPPARGLGSSGATSAATAYALSVALSAKLDERDLLELAGAGEAYVAGTRHYDNVAASLFGGFVILDLARGRVLRYLPKTRIPVAIVVPDLTLPRKTGYARSLLPKQVSLELHVRQSSSLAKLLYGILTEDPRVLGEAISTDYIVEPSRARMIPFYNDVKELALREGTYGFNICGAGPSVFLLHEDPAEALRIAEKVRVYLSERGVRATAFVSHVSPRGVELLEVVR